MENFPIHKCMENFPIEKCMEQGFRAQHACVLGASMCVCVCVCVLFRESNFLSIPSDWSQKPQGGVVRASFPLDEYRVRPFPYLPQSFRDSGLFVDTIALMSAAP